MSRTEKVVAFLMSVLVFAGLFFFIYSSLRAPVNAPPLSEPDYYGDEEDLFDFEEETVTPPAAAPVATPKPAVEPKTETKK
ncbi:MAG: hypothetical protein KBD85_01860 [Elusimicrobia bacterium]|nr:hypothetical protein [Elusimicrobiota bacterium]MBP9128085.1 hypothetical protein [Elusimicrobiota bacterium]MBP9698740.1 hypothetical protein [Elusimicrobiota bacterium]